MLDRPHNLHMTLSIEERDLTARLAARERISVSDYIRKLIYREAGEHLGWTLDGVKKSKTKKTTA